MTICLRTRCGDGLLLGGSNAQAEMRRLPGFGGLEVVSAAMQEACWGAAPGLLILWIIAPRYCCSIRFKDQIIVCA